MNTDDFQLIYQPIPPDGSNEAFADALKDIVSRSETVAIASPYLSFDVVEPLAAGRIFRLVTDQAACFEAGIDPSLYEYLQEYRERMRSVRGLHAKVVLGEHAGLFGSANLTTTGLSRRFEMACIVRGSRLNELKTWFEDLWNYGVALDLTGLAKLAARPAVTSVPAERPTHVGLPYTGRPGWLSRPPRHDARRSPVAGRPPTRAVPHEAGNDAFNALAARLGELTEDRSTATQVLDLFALALDHAGLHADDERLHLNCRRPRHITITIGQRHIAWCYPVKRVPMFGMMLDDFALAARIGKRIRGAVTGVYTKNKRPEVPTINVPIAELSRLSTSVFASWQRAVEHEVLTAGRSSYRQKTCAELHSILGDRDERLAAAHLAHPTAWWFGVNNATNGHMTLEALEPLFEGGTLRWPFGHSKTVPSGAYKTMLPRDRVLIWTGRGRDESWGLIGSGAIEHVEADHVILGRGMRFDSPLTPYPRKQPEETHAVRFLLEVFGQNFEPLGDIRRAIYDTPRTRPITVARLRDEQFERVIAHLAERKAQ